MENRKITIEETFANFSISNIKFFENKIIFGECKNLLMNHYGIKKEESLYALFLEIFSPNNTEENKELYELYYPAEEGYLINIDLSICDNIISNNLFVRCQNYSFESILKESCLSCKDGYGQIPVSNNTHTDFFKCITPPEGYYYDKIKMNIEPCFTTCKTCNKEGFIDTNNCLECKNNTKHIPISLTSNLFNCNEECPLNFYYYIEENTNKIFSVEKCNDIYNYHIEPEKKCVQKCEGDYKYVFKKYCYKECPDDSFPSKDKEFFCEIKCSNKDLPYLNLNTQECISNCTIKEMFNQICKKSYKDEDETKKEDISKEIIDNIMNGNLDDILQDLVQNDKEIIIKEENEVHQISTLSKQGENKNVSSINFGECEKILRNKSNISSDEELVIYKIEHFIEGYNIPIIEYVLFSQDGKIKLNLEECNNYY